MIPYGRQEITEGDVESVVAVLQSDFLTQGPAVPRFESAVAEHVGARHAVATNSATSALHLACMALDLGPGDLLWTVPNTFVASANCALYCGASVDFVDIDPATWDMDTAALEDKLRSSVKQDRLPRIVVPVHFAGQPTDQETIWRLAKEYGFRVIEDASHSIGAARNGRLVGSCEFSDISVFSFHPVKIITTGEGGLSLTNSRFLADRMARLRTHGITRNSEHLQSENPPPWHYEQLDLGFNYRMTDIQAALGLSQLDRLDAYVERRNDLARRYDYLLADLPIQRPTIRDGSLSAFHLYVIRLPGASASHHRYVFEGLRRRGIGVNVHYMPVHLQPYYRAVGFAPGDFPEAERHGVSAITLPLYPTMTHAMQDEVVRALRHELPSK